MFPLILPIAFVGGLIAAITSKAVSSSKDSPAPPAPARSSSSGSQSSSAPQYIPAQILIQRYTMPTGGAQAPIVDPSQVGNFIV